MSRLSQRLTLLRKQAEQEVLKAKQLNNEQSLADKLRHTRVSLVNQPSKKLSDDELAKQVKGEVLSEGLIYIKSEFSLNQLHNIYDASQLGEFLKLWPESICEDTRSLLFVDTETTGLSNGVGTLVFLLGVAEIENQMVINHQLLLNGFHGEIAMLEWLNKKLNQKKTLVSYNGKSFDLPLLVSRYRLKRMASPLLTLEHIDLVHWIRRMYQKYWPNCRLQSAEQFCLNFQRINDMPGAEAPAIFSELIREGKIDRLNPLCQHHRHDVISLIALLDHVAKCVNTPTEEIFNVYTTANYLVKSKRQIVARELLERNREQTCERGRFLLASIYRREKRWDDALELLHPLSDENHTPAIEALAKYFEHKQKHLGRALGFAERLYQLEPHNRHIRRILRLKDKISNA